MKREILQSGSLMPGSPPVILHKLTIFKERVVKYYICYFFLFIFFFNTVVFGDILYNIDFSSPTHTVGSQMSIGNGPVPRDTPSESVFGEQIVVSSYGPLTQQPVKLVPGGYAVGGRYTYSQFRLDLYTFHYPLYKLDFDLSLSNMTLGSLDGFILFFDVPSVVSLYFENDGTILEHDYRHSIYSYNFNEILSMSILVNLPENTWDISCNSQNLYTGQFFYPNAGNPDLPTGIKSLRFCLSDDISYPDIPVAVIDNIKVQGIPEPGTALLLGLGGLFLRKRK